LDISLLGTVCWEQSQAVSSGILWKIRQRIRNTEASIAEAMVGATMVEVTMEEAVTGGINGLAVYLAV